MSILDTEKEFLIPMPYYKNYLIIDDNKSKTNRKVVVLAEINEEIEKQLDELEEKAYELKINNKTFTITHRNIYCYGEINLNDEATCNIISGFNFLDYLGGVGIHIFSRYDYNLHACKSNKRKALITETWNPLDLVKYAHGCLNKPNRIILFKYYPK